MTDPCFYGIDPYAYQDKVTVMPPLIITVAVNGGVQGKEMHGSIPEDGEEIAEETRRAYEAGASVVHIHPRNPDCLWDASDDPAVIRDVNRRVREKCPEIIINNSTGGGLFSTNEGRMRILDGEPELASLNMGPDMGLYHIPARPAPLKHPRDAISKDHCWAVTYGLVAGLAARMKEKEIKPEMEIYHNGQYWVSRYLIEKDLLKPPYYFQYVMGYQTGAFPLVDNVMNLIHNLPQQSVFSIIGVGKFQWVMTTLSIMLGGNVRVGLEDNLYVRRGEKLRDNAHAVERIVQMARYLGREISTPGQAREILGISAVPRRYSHGEQ